MNQFELINNVTITDDDIKLFDAFYEGIQAAKEGLRGNIVLTLLVGSSFLARANEQNRYNVCDFENSISVENGKEVSDDISEYIKKISYIEKQNISKYSLIEKILLFKSLENNWDGFAAIPLEIKSATNSILLLDLIGEEVFCMVKDFYPNPNGTISFEWYNQQDESVFLEVGNNTFSYYVALNSVEIQYFNKQIINEENTKLLSMFIKSI